MGADMNLLPARLFLSVLALIGFSRVSAAEPAVDTRLRGAAEAYLANLESFKFLTCRYTVSSGTARSLADALAGKYEQSTTCPTRLWLMDGKNLLHRQQADEESLKRMKTGVPVPIPGKPGMLRGPSLTFDSSDHLLDGRIRLLNSPLFGSTINVCPLDPEIIDDSPFDWMGWDRELTNIHYCVQQTLAGAYSCEKCEMQDLDGRPVVLAAFVKKATGLRLEFTLDTERGMLPLQFKLINKDPQRGYMICDLKSARKCSKGRWFPDHILAIDVHPNVKPFLKEIKVVELDVDNRPKADAFSFPVPGGTLVINCKEPLKNFRLKQDETIDLASLPALLEMTYRAKEKPQFDTAIPRPRSFRWLWWTGAGVLGVACAGTFGYRWRRKRLG